MSFFSKVLFLFMVFYLSFYWCCSRNRSFTVFTGLNVEIGTSTNTVFQSDMAPFHSPGNSRAFNSFPFFDFSDMNPVFLSTKFRKIIFLTLLVLNGANQIYRVEMSRCVEHCFRFGVLKVDLRTFKNL